MLPTMPTSWARSIMSSERTPDSRKATRVSPEVTFTISSLDLCCGEEGIHLGDGGAGQHLFRICQEAFQNFLGPCGTRGGEAGHDGERPVRQGRHRGDEGADVQPLRTLFPA